MAEFLKVLTFQNAREILQQNFAAPAAEIIPEQQKPTLVILHPKYLANPDKLNGNTKPVIERIATKKGNSERVYRNTMLFLVCSEVTYGKLQSDEVRVVEAAVFDKLKEFLNLGDKYSNTLKDLNISFNIRDGRVKISPFDIKMGNIKMNISGDHGLDQTLNYLVKVEIPSSELGSSVNNLINNLSAQASSFGIVFKPADVIKVNVRIRGTVDKPEVTPDFGSGAEGKTGTVKETARETVKQTIDNAVDKGKEKLSQEAEEMGNKLIKEAEEKGQQLRDGADKAALKLKEEAEAKAAEMIKAAETKGAVARAAAKKAADALIKEAEKEGNRLRQEADKQAIRLVEEAKAKKEEMINKK